MNRNLDITVKAAAAILSLTMAVRAEFPLGSMGPRNLGIQYCLAFRGQDITNQNVPSHEIIHAFNLGYSPIPYLGLEAGLGLDRFVVDPYQSVRFRGEYGISPHFGLTLSTPSLLEVVRLAGGARALFLNSKDDRGYSYSGFISSPWLAAVLSPSPWYDLQAGIRGHFINGTMEGPGGTAKAFGNGETIRGAASFTLKSPSESAFMTLDFDFSPSFDGNWSDGPHESSIGISFGTLLGWKSKNPEAKPAPAYFPAYPELKERLKKMAEDEE